MEVRQPLGKQPDIVKTVYQNDNVNQKIADNAFVSHKYLIKNSVSNVFAARFSPDGNYIAASYADGSVHIHTVFKGDRVFSPKIVQKEEAEAQVVEDSTTNGKRNLPVVVIKPIITSLCWRPSSIDGGDSAFQNFKGVTTDGRIVSWRPEKAHLLTTLATSETNYYHTIDFSNDGGSKLVCAGKLPIIEIYDDETMKRVSDYSE